MHPGYDEFGFLHENAEEMGLEYDEKSKPRPDRVFVGVGGGRRLSAIVWGESDPELVLLHGGAQNAHTWDSVALALGRPLVAVDLPGHGHSDGGRDGSRDVNDFADDVAAVIDEVAPRARGVVGMSLGGITSIALLSRRPDLVRSHVLVDITPGVTHDKSREIIEFIAGPETFDSFDEILERTVAFNPTRSRSSLRRGVLHNAVETDDGKWVWRWQRFRTDDKSPLPDYAGLWDAIGNASAPLMLVRGMRPGSVVDDADEAELSRRRPDARVEHVADAGHSIQGDAPLELARLLADFVS